MLFLFANTFKCSVAFGNNHALRKTHLRYSVAKFHKRNYENAVHHSPTEKILSFSIKDFFKTMFKTELFA